MKNKSKDLTLNSPNFLDQEVALEVSLRRVLRNWGSRQQPVRSVRSEVLRRAGEPKSVSINRLVALHRQARNREESDVLTALPYLHHLSFVSAWINF